jgi:pteridine reductase
MPNSNTNACTHHRLAGKVALVTGAARRIGAVIAQTLHRAGADVVIHYRSSATEALALQQQLNIQRENSCFIVQADLLVVEQLPMLIEQVIAQTQRLDILINNASSFYPSPIGNIALNEWDDLMGSNLKAPLFLSQAVAPYLRQHLGCIVNIIDIHGLRPMKNYTVYSTAKAGLAMLTHSLARELGAEIRVNGVAPGAIIWPENDMDAAMTAGIIAKTALKRQGSPEDIAKAVLFLVRDADYITGHIIPVDGGRLLNH